MLSEPEAAYESAASAFLESLGKNRLAPLWFVKDLTPEQMHTLTQEDNLIVSIGMRAVRFVSEHHAGRAAVLGMMVPKTSVEKIAWRSELGAGRLAFIYIDQPVERSLALLAALMPGRERIGVIVSQENADVLKALSREVDRRGLMLRSAIVENIGAVGPALRRVLTDSEVILLVPDALVLSSANLQSLLMASYRARVPVLGFSPGLVKAGAVAAVFSSPEQIGWQGGNMARRWQTGGSLPPSQYATRFSMDINDYVARSLGLTLPPEAEVAKELGARN